MECRHFFELYLHQVKNYIESKLPVKPAVKVGKQTQNHSGYGVANIKTKVAINETTNMITKVLFFIPVLSLTVITFSLMMHKIKNIFLNKFFISERGGVINI